VALESGRHRYDAVEGLRAVAAFLVVTTHVAYWTGFVHAGFLGGLAARGDLGVAVFFVLSGFLLSRPWLSAAFEKRPGPSVRRYSVHRAARLLPAYYLALAAVLLTASLIEPLDDVEPPVTLESVTAHLLLAQAYFGPLFSTFSQTWSLTTEVAFYVLLPALGMFAMHAVRHQPPSTSLRRVLTGCLGGLLFGLLVTGLAAGDVLPFSNRVALSVLGHAGWFAMGVGVAAMIAAERAGRAPLLRHPAYQLLRTSPNLLAAAAGILILIAVTPVAGPREFVDVPSINAVVKELLYALIATAMLLAALSRDAGSSVVLRVLSSPSVRFLGRISYGVFLWHLVVIQWLYAMTGWGLFTGGFWFVLATTTAVTVAVASASYFLLEQRVLSWARAYQSPRESAHSNQSEELGDIAPQLGMPQKLEEHDREPTRGERSHRDRG
jgi:peptidoglycan/LPS O-acetylase OafA/YrhL